jgi:hypothetical protein
VPPSDEVIMQMPCCTLQRIERMLNRSFLLTAGRL